MPQSKRILLVDDDKLMRRMYAAVLRKDEFDVVEYASAEDALEHLIEGDTCDLVITDIMMAKMDGWEFLDTIRKDLKLDDLTLPVIIISAFNSDTLVAKALGRGANGCLTKPVKPLAKLTKLARIHTGRVRSKFDVTND